MIDDATRKYLEDTVAGLGGPVGEALRGAVHAALKRDDARRDLVCPERGPCLQQSTCMFSTDGSVCVIEQQRERVMSFVRRLNNARVPLRECNVIEKHMRGICQLEPTDAVRAVKQWCAERPRKAILVLSGGPGIGKTLAAAYGMGRTSGFYSTSYSYARINDDLMLSAKMAAALVIDQLDFDGSEVPSFAAQQIREVLDARYAAQRPTILCTNQDRAWWIKTFGVTMDDRLEGDGRWVSLTGKSLRRNR